MSRESASSPSEERLANALAAAGVSRPIAEVRDLIAGIAAGPTRRDPLEPLTLIAPDLPADAAAEFRAIADELAAAYDSEIEKAGAAAGRLKALRGELKRLDVDGFVVPRNDEFNGEYVPRSADRLCWLTGFTGSAGMAVVLADKAAIFVDGRYTLQVRDQVDTDLFAPRHVTQEPVSDWLTETLSAGQKLAYDPWLHTADGLKRLEKGCAKAGAELVPLEPNPLDTVWGDQPPPPLTPVVPHSLNYAGESASDKRARLAEALQKDDVAAAVITLPDSIAWLLNIRGADVPHSPLPLGFAILHDDATVDLILDRRKVTPGLTEHLGNGVALHERDGFGSLLDRLGTDGKRVRVDPAVTGVWVANRLKAAGATVQAGRDPCTLPKACKNDVEVAGARSAHVRDGAAVTRFLAWLARASGNGALDEIAAADRLRAFRMENDLIEDLSFTTISGAGPNGAIVHYRVTPETNRKLEPGSLFLVDSGAQYLDGTTDITRTVAIGRPSDEMRERFTRVLKGHIAIATCRFPEGTDGGQIDALARHALWQVGLDFDHGTGHGVGSYLNVHEGPQRISKMGGSAAMKPGMIVSNEPGYYKTGEYGIRIENLVVVRDAAEQPGERKLLEFETLTRAPIDRALVDVSLLTDAELDWLNRYHATVRADIAPLVDDETAAWLKQATEPIER